MQQLILHGQLLLVGLVALALAGLVAIRIRWLPAVGAAFAVILLLGAATLGSAAVSYRLTHPAEPLGFAEDFIQVAGEVLAIGAGIAATAQLGRHRLVADRHQRRAPGPGG